MNLGGGPGRAEDAARGWILAGVVPRRFADEQRRVPERVPAVLRDHLRRQLDAGRAQRIRLLRGHAPHAGHDVVFGGQMFAEDRPGRTGRPDRQIAHERPSLDDLVARAKLGVAVAAPRDDEQIFRERGVESGSAFVMREIPPGRIRRGHRRRPDEKRSRQGFRHVHAGRYITPGRRSSTSAAENVSASARQASTSLPEAE